MSLIHSPVSNRSKSGKTKLPFFPSRTQGKPIRYFEKKKKREGGDVATCCGVQTSSSAPSILFWVNLFASSSQRLLVFPEDFRSVDPEILKPLSIDIDLLI
jgi:hypothetical protein